jgi:hypothetical protein
MGEKTGYSPMFEGMLPTDVPSRWRLIRSFVDCWCMGESGPLLDRSQENTPLIAQAQALASGELSFSIRQWLSLAKEARVRGAPHIRDCILADPIESEFEHPDVKDFTVILMQGEGDIFWTVANHRLCEEDPPVDIFQCYDEESPPYLGRYAAVSEFALAYTYNSCAEGCVASFSAEVDDEELEQIRKWFEYSLVIASEGPCCGREKYIFCELLERENVAAIAGDHQVAVSVFCDPSAVNLPPLLREAWERKRSSRNSVTTLD